MYRFGSLKKLFGLWSTLLTACFVGSASVICAGEIAQVITDQSVLGPPTELQFEPFREFAEDGMRRTLTGVELSYDGEASMDVVVENFDTTPYDSGEWSYDFYHSVLFSFDSKAGYPDGGPFSFIGGLAIEGANG